MVHKIITKIIRVNEPERLPASFLFTLNILSIKSSRSFNLRHFSNSVRSYFYLLVSCHLCKEWQLLITIYWTSLFKLLSGRSLSLLPHQIHWAALFCFGKMLFIRKYFLERQQTSDAHTPAQQGRRFIGDRPFSFGQWKVMVSSPSKCHEKNASHFIYKDVVSHHHCSQHRFY